MFWHAIGNGGPILVSLNILGTCLENDPGYETFCFFRYSESLYFSIIIDLILNVNFKVHYIVDAT